MKLTYLFIFASILLINSCKKKSPEPTPYVQNTTEFTPKYCYIKGILIDSVSLLPANNVFMKQVLSCSSCIQSQEVINGEFFFTYCSQWQSGGVFPSFECGVPTTGALFVLSAFENLPNTEDYELVSAQFPEINDGDTAIVQITARIPQI